MEANTTSPLSIPIDYRYIPEGKGGTFCFRPNIFGADKDLREIHHIGTHVCVTCVGVYFKVDDDRSFCAHIKVDNGFNHPKNLIMQSDGQELRTMVFERLVAHGEAEGWDIHDLEFGENLIIVCPKSVYVGVGGNEYDRTGRWVVDAIRWMLEYCNEGIRLETMVLRRDAERKREEMPEEEVEEKHGTLVVCEMAHRLEHKARSLISTTESPEERVKNVETKQSCYGFIVKHSTGKAQLPRTGDLPAKEGDTIRFSKTSTVGIPLEWRDYTRRDQPSPTLSSWEFCLPDNSVTRYLAESLADQELQSPTSPASNKVPWKNGVPWTS